MVETWAPINGFEARYLVSDFGNIKSREREIYTRKTKRIVKSKILSRSYGSGNTRPFICLRGDNGKKSTKSIAKIVAEAFIQNPNKYRYIEMIDGNNDNCQVNNIKWVRHNPFRGDIKKSELPELEIIYENIQKLRRQKKLSLAELSATMKVSNVTQKINNHTLRVMDLYYLSSASGVELYKFFIDQTSLKELETIKSERDKLNKKVKELEYINKLQKRIIENGQ